MNPMAMVLDAADTISEEHEQNEAIASTIGNEQNETGEPDASTGNDEDSVSDDVTFPSPDDGNTSGSPSEHDDDFWNELEIIGEIAQAERDRQQCQVELDDLTQQRKETKQELDAAVIRLHQATSRLVDHIGDRELPQKPTSESADQSDEESTAWQETPTAELLDGVKGLGKKKLEAIVDLAPTAGKLEELRGQASLEHKPFKDVLPKGCGQNLADAIEDRLVELVAKMDTPSVAEQIAEREREQIAEAVENAEQVKQAEQDDGYEDVEDDDDTLANL